MDSSNPRSRVGTNQESVRRHNLSTLLRHLHLAGPLSRSSLASLMGLNRSTIADLVAQAEVLQLADQHARLTGGQSSAGRPSVGVGATEHAHVLAVDVRVSGLVVSRVGLGGRLLSQATGPSPDGHDPSATAEGVARLTHAVLRDVRHDSVLVGIGVGIPGIIAGNNGIVRLAPNLGWRDVPFADILADRLGTNLRPILGNDADLGALAEHLRGVGSGVDDVVYVSGEVGVGAGIVTGGAPVSGMSGFAGEIGHLPFGDGSRPCHCGAVGCWETEIGAAAIARAVGCPSDQLSELGCRLDGIPSAPEELREVGRHLGRGLAGLVALLNPEIIVLGGYLRALYPWVREDVSAEMDARALKVTGIHPEIVLPGLGDRSVLIGAAEMAFRDLLDDPVNCLARARRTSALAVN